VTAALLCGNPLSVVAPGASAQRLNGRRTKPVFWLETVRGCWRNACVKLASEAGDNRPIGFMQATAWHSFELGKRIQSLINLERRSWSPLSRARVCAVKVIVPTALVAGATLCTAWIKPPEQGEAMNINKPGTGPSQH